MFHCVPLCTPLVNPCVICCHDLQVLVFFTWVVRGVADTVSMWDAVERVASFATEVGAGRLLWAEAALSLATLARHLLLHKLPCLLLHCGPKLGPCFFSTCKQTFMMML